jgi:hypothetical protein
MFERMLHRTTLLVMQHAYIVRQSYQIFLIEDTVVTPQQVA